MKETEGVFFMRVGDEGVEERERVKERERGETDNSVRERRAVQDFI